MKPWMKPTLYLVLGLLALWMAVGFYTNYRASNAAAAKRQVDSEADPARLTDTARLTTDTRAQGRMMGYAFGLVACAIGIGFLISRDFSTWFAGNAVDTLLTDNVDPVKNPDYDQAEQAALEGRPMLPGLGEAVLSQRVCDRALQAADSGLRQPI